MEIKNIKKGLYYDSHTNLLLALLMAAISITFTIVGIINILSDFVLYIMLMCLFATCLFSYVFYIFICEFRKLNFCIKQLDHDNFKIFNKNLVGKEIHEDSINSYYFFVNINNIRRRFLIDVNVYEQYNVNDELNIIEFNYKQEPVYYILENVCYNT